LKAIVATKLGGPGVLELREVPEPKCGPGEVLIDVEAAGVNFADTMITAGLYPGGPKPPFILGLEFAGRAVGTGERVMGFAANAFAERVAVPRKAALPIPEQWDMATAAAFPITYFTAYFAYWMAQVRAGQTVLIQAVAVGVGTAAVEVGAQLGVSMFGTASSDEKLAKVKELGLHQGINYKKEDYVAAVRKLTNGKGVDAVFEMLGGAETVRGLQCLKPFGHMVIYGSASGAPPQIDFLTMFHKNLSVHALWLSQFKDERELMMEAAQVMFGWAANGKLHPVVGHKLPLAQAGDALRLLLERKNFAKVVLEVKR